MNRKSVKLLITSTIIPILIFSNFLSVQGFQTVIASRISKINDIIVIPNPDYQIPNVTYFGIDVEVEILNREEENQTVVELAIQDPKIIIEATFTNQSLEYGAIVIAFPQIKRYSYLPGITIETDYLVFYIFQENMTQLPDGNYILYRPIFWETTNQTIVAGEMLKTNFTVTSGVVDIIYANFTNDNPTDNVTFSGTAFLAFVLLYLYPMIRLRRKKSRIV